MSLGFNKFKRRMTLHHLLRCALLSLSVGMLASGVLIMLYKFASLSLTPLVSIIIGAGIVLILMIPLFLILKPRDGTVAKRLDVDLSLGERVQTMLRYSETDGEMIEIQRNDAIERLESLPASLIKPKKIIAFAAAFVMTLSFFVSSLVIPVAAETPPEEPTVGADEKENYILTLRQLIEMVEKSFMQDSLKAADVAVLEGLIEVIEGTDHFSVMKAAAITATIKVNDNVVLVNSASPISKELSKSDVELLQGLGSALSELSTSSARKALRNIRTEVKGATTDEVFALSNGLDAAVRNAGTQVGDPVTSAFLVFASALSAMAEKDDFSGIEDAVDAVDDAISEPLLTQKDNRLTSDKVIVALIVLFGITEDELTDSETGDSLLGDSDDGGYTPPDEDDPMTDEIFDGAVGSEDGNFASDDLIYSPDDDAYVKYSEIIDRYLAIAKDRAEDGIIDGMTAEGIIEYFKTLFGSDTEDTEE